MSQGVPGLAALSDDPSPELLRDLLHEVIDPELGVDIVELGLLREVTVRAGVARVRFTVTTPACPLSGYIEDEIYACLAQVPGLRQVLIATELDPPWKAEDMSEAARAALRMAGLSAAAPPGSRLLRRAPLLAAALVALLAGLWAGLLRLGFDLPPLRPALAAEHGPLLVLGFLGTQIGLERAVALGAHGKRRWPYLAPSAAAAGALWLLAGLPARGGWLLLALGGLALVAVFLVVQRLDPTWHNAVMGLGALAWLAATLVWLAGEPIVRTVPFLAAFLVLTIVGERLELSRMRHPPRAVRAALLAAVALFCLGVALSLPLPTLGIRLAGAGLLAQAAWLARYDVARRTIRMSGLTRYMAVALLAGYFWLAVAGGVWLCEGELAGGGFAYDAMLHAIFLGFVFSMIFAHAAVIVPAILGVALPYRRSFYGPLALLHASVAIRLLGDLDGNVAAWRWGGVLGEVAILTFIALAAASALRARRQRRVLTQPA